MNWSYRLPFNLALSLIMVFSSLNAYATPAPSALTPESMEALAVEENFQGYAVVVPEEGEMAYISKCYLGPQSITPECVADMQVAKTDLKKFYKKMRSSRYTRRAFNFAAQTVAAFTVGAVVIFFGTLALSAWVGIPVLTTLFGMSYMVAETVATYGTVVALTGGVAAFTFSIDIFGANERQEVQEALRGKGGLIQSAKAIRLFEKELLNKYGSKITMDPEALEATIAPLM